MLSDNRVQAIDRELDEVYSKVLQRNIPYRVNLAKSQEAWLVYRDRESEFRRCRLEGGSAAGMIAASVHEELTRQRIEYLNGLLIEGTL